MPSIMKVFESKRDHLHKAFKELEKVINPSYQEAAFYIPAKRTYVIQHSQNLITALNTQKEAIMSTIGTIIQKMRSEIEDMDTQHIAAIDKQVEVINLTINKTKQIILDLRR